MPSHRDPLEYMYCRNVLQKWLVQCWSCDCCVRNMNLLIRLQLCEQGPTLAVFGARVFISLVFVLLSLFKTGHWKPFVLFCFYNLIWISYYMRSDGCLHRRKASRASCAASEGETRRRSSSGRKNSDDTEAPLGLSLHCDPWPPGEGPVSADVGDSRAWVKGFYTPVIMFVITKRTDGDQPLKTCFHGYPDRQKIQWFLFFFFFVFSPKHCDCVCERLHPILYLCNVEPCSACRGLPDARAGE